MPIWGLLQLSDVANQNSNEKKLREILMLKGYNEDFIKTADGAIGYAWLDEGNKKKFQKRAGVSKEELERRFNVAYMVMFLHEEIADLLIHDKKKAKEAHEQAVSMLENEQFVSMLEKLKNKS
jgi:hypothetical protein